MQSHQHCVYTIDENNLSELLAISEMGIFLGYIEPGRDVVLGAEGGVARRRRMEVPYAVDVGAVVEAPLAGLGAERLYGSLLPLILVI